MNAPTLVYCCCCSAAQLCWTLCDPMDCSTPGFPVLHYLPEFAQTHVNLVSDAIQPSHPVFPFSSCPQSFPASGSFPVSRLFASGSQSFGSSASVSVLPMNIQGCFPLGLTGLTFLLSKILKSLLQHHSSNASIPQCSTFFMVQLSHPYVIVGETIPLTRRTFFSKVMSLLFNLLSTFVIAFLPRNKHLLILWLQSSSAVILEPKKIKSVTVFLYFMVY